MRTRGLVLGLLALLAALWATWPDASHAWLGVLLLVGVGALHLGGRRREGLAALAAAALATTLLPATLFEWRPWAAAVLLVALLAVLLSPPEVEPRAPRPSLVVAALSLAALLVILRVWTPTRDVLGTRSGAGLAVVALSAVGLALLLLLTAPGEEPAEGEEA